MRAPSISECLSFGWITFKKRPGLFIGAALILFAVGFGVGILEGIVGITAGIDKEAMKPFEQVISLIMNMFASMGIIALYLRAHDDVMTATFKELWQPKYFWPFLGMSVITFIAVFLGIIALIVPGVIIALAFSFAGQLMIERGLGPIEALKESARTTKGHRLFLFGLGCMSLLVNLVGALALLIGLFVTVPVTVLAFVHAYRHLSGTTPELESVVVPVPEALPAV